MVVVVVVVVVVGGTVGGMVGAGKSDRSGSTGPLVQPSHAVTLEQV